MFRKRPQASTLISFAALGVALASPAIAATVITSKDIKNGTIKSVDVKDDEIRSIDIRNRTILPQDLAGGVLDSPRTVLAKVNRAPGKIANARLNTGPGGGLDADTVDGVDSASLQHSCADGSVRGFARVNGTASNFPKTPTDGATFLPVSFNCTGAAVRVRKISDGKFRVSLSGLDNRSVAIATVHDDDTDVAIASRKAGSWEVVIRDIVSGGADNRDFSILVL